MCFLSNQDLKSHMCSPDWKEKWWKRFGGSAMRAFRHSVANENDNLWLLWWPRPSLYMESSPKGRDCAGPWGTSSPLQESFSSLERNSRRFRFHLKLGDPCAANWSVQVWRCAQLSWGYCSCSHRRFYFSAVKCVSALSRAVSVGFFL